MNTSNSYPSNLGVALQYASRGVNVFPCRECDDQYGTCKSPYIQGGMNSASNDIGTVLNWWDRYPGAVVGLPCRQNGIIVIDADQHGDTDGVTAMLDIFKAHGFDPTQVPVAATPNDGVHFYFTRPDTLGNTRGKIADAVDVRDNAYVIAPGSYLVDGREYKLWGRSLTQLANGIQARSFSTPPEWLNLLLAKELVQAPFKRRYNPKDLPLDNESLMRRLTGIIRKTSSAREGERNNTLHWAACRLGEMVVDEIILPDVALEILLVCGERIGLPERETLNTAKSGILRIYSVKQS